MLSVGWMYEEYVMTYMSGVSRNFSVSRLLKKDTGSKPVKRKV